MKIGIFGGTFNPIHIGHLILAQNALDFCDLSEVIFIPTGCSYLKEQKHILPKNERLKMVEIAITDNPMFSLSTIETDTEGNTYTCETLAKLKKIYPNDELCFIIGADTLYSIDSWKNPDEIFSLSSIIAAPRDNHSLDELKKQIKYLEDKYNATIYLMDSENIEISSSVIRSKISKGSSARYYLPKNVSDYINSNNFYKDI